MRQRTAHQHGPGEERLRVVAWAPTQRACASVRDLLQMSAAHCLGVHTDVDHAVRTVLQTPGCQLVLAAETPDRTAALLGQIRAMGAMKAAAGVVVLSPGPTLSQLRDWTDLGADAVLVWPVASAALRRAFRARAHRRMSRDANAKSRAQVRADVRAQTQRVRAAVRVALSAGVRPDAADIAAVAQMVDAARAAQMSDVAAAGRALIRACERGAGEDELLVHADAVARLAAADPRDWPYRAETVRALDHLGRRAVGRATRSSNCADRLARHGTEPDPHHHPALKR